MGLENPKSVGDRIKRKIVLAAMRSAKRLEPIQPQS
jgi:hypothetical protein